MQRPGLVSVNRERKPKVVPHKGVPNVDAIFGNRRGPHHWRHQKWKKITFGAFEDKLQRKKKTSDMENCSNLFNSVCWLHHLELQKFFILGVISHSHDDELYSNQLLAFNAAGVLYVKKKMLELPF